MSEEDIKIEADLLSKLSDEEVVAYMINKANLLTIYNK